MATLSANTFKNRLAAETHYLAAIDSAAADARRLDPAQAEVYREKLAQAKAGGGQLLDAEADALGTDADTVRNAVLRNHNVRQQHVNAVELQRIKAKADVRSATTAAAMHRIFNEFKGAL